VGIINKIKKVTVVLDKQPTASKINRKIVTMLLNYDLTFNVTVSKF